MVLSIDLGTTNIRSAVFDDELRMRSCESLPHPLIALSQTEVEQDAQIWWDCTRRSMKLAIEASGVDPSAIDAISLSSQGISVVPVDFEGRPMRAAISWLDSRAEAQTRELTERCDPETLYHRTGKRVSATYTLPKLMWLREYQRDIFDRCWKFMLPMDYILYRLCGRCATDATMAAGTMFYDLRARVWMRDMLEELGIDPDKLPEVLDAGEAAGTLRREVAEEMGLRPGTVVAVGGQDQKCAAMGAGFAPGIMTASLGTACAISAYAREPIHDPQMRIPWFTYLEPGAWVLEGVLGTAASCYQWLRDKFARDMSFDDLNAAAEAVEEPGMVAFYPNLAGGSAPHWNDAGGIFANLTLNADIGHLARAVLEGVAYKMRENVEAMRALTSQQQELRIFGGGANSDLWCRIIADVTGIPVVRPGSAETALLGAAMLARRALGMPAAVPSDAQTRRFEPDAARMRAYSAAYEAYEAKRRRYYEQ